VIKRENGEGGGEGLTVSENSLIRGNGEYESFFLEIINWPRRLEESKKE